MKRMKNFLPIMMAAVLLSACAGKTDDKGNVQESSGEGVVKEETQEPEKKEEKKEETGSLKDLVTERTYFEQYTHESFLIDFVEYPSFDSGIGKLEEVGDSRTFLGVCRVIGNYDGGDMEKVSDITDVPEVFAESINSNFSKARMYGGGSMGILAFEGAEYSSIEEVGEIIGYEWCRYEGEFVYSWAEEEYRHKVVGYTTYLKNTGYPIFITAMDGSEDQSNGDKLEELAYNCMTTLRELTDEEEDQLLKDLGYTF